MWIPNERIQHFKEDFYGDNYEIVSKEPLNDGWMLQIKPWTFLENYYQQFYDKKGYEKLIQNIHLFLMPPGNEKYVVCTTNVVRVLDEKFDEFSCQYKGSFDVVHDSKDENSTLVRFKTPQMFNNIYPYLIGEGLPAAELASFAFKNLKLISESQAVY